ncbi:homoserine dehydrogenase [Pilimelia terevasa]|uniref:Homoserine dehydrogenase n=1 Tax=Pilimelia terevasa TaxID=53372 RepID=A0A8J3FE44_9ACTN|nr:homoserine dehydrogenase [Pilimelia terevasa]GGK12685.1 homoserine dehydrogenase [Pilimelia terevasa]
MSTVAAPPAVRTRVTHVVLLGTGVVGSAFLDRLARLRHKGIGTHLRLVQVANSRRRVAATDGLDPRVVAQLLPDGRVQRLDSVASALGATGVVVDATASEDVASWHARWLRSGLAVATANKAGIGGELARYRAIDAHADRYGDAATVGAGLPLLRALARLRAGGDRIHALAGVLSGSLAWLLDAYDGEGSFADLVRQARKLGYAEPDPRVDLSGVDVLRKLLILARRSGTPLPSSAVRVESLLPPALARAGLAEVDAALDGLDAPMAARYATAAQAGRRLRYVARLAADGTATVGLEALAVADPLAGGGGCDNRVTILSDRYPDRPLVIQGPGAGAEVTAAALLDDVLRLAEAPAP